MPEAGDNKGFPTMACEVLSFGGGRPSAVWGASGRDTGSSPPPKRLAPGRWGCAWYLSSEMLQVFPRHFARPCPARLPNQGRWALLCRRRKGANLMAELFRSAACFQYFFSCLLL